MSVQSNARASAPSRFACSRTHVSATEADSRIVVPSVPVTRTAPAPGETARLDDPETAALGAHSEAHGDARPPGPVGELTLAERRLGDARA